LSGATHTTTRNRRNGRDASAVRADPADAAEEEVAARELCEQTASAVAAAAALARPVFVRRRAVRGGERQRPLRGDRGVALELEYGLGEPHDAQHTPRGAVVRQN